MSITSITNDAPMMTTGRDLARRRLELGVSQHAVARALGIHTATLGNWERALEPVDAERVARWDAALSATAQARVRSLRRQGWTTNELPAALRSALLRGGILTK